MSSKNVVINNDDQSNNSNYYPSKIINESKNLCLMKKGDYSVHILVEEVKSLIQLEKDHLPYPIVKLTCFNKSQRTDKTKIACINYIYDEHFYFEKENLTVEQLDSSKIIVEVYDASNSKRKDYFGIYEFDIEYIYSMENHTLNNHWLMLSNPESKDMTAIRGYLKLSISVLHDSDPRMELKSNPDSSNCLTASQAKPKYEQLKIFLIRGEEFPDMDSIIAKKTNRECDPYVEFQYFGLNLKSKIAKNIKDVAKWNQIIYLPVHIPIVSQKIVLLVKDHDTIGSDDNIGSYEINVNDIIGEKNLYENYKFYDIYVSHKNSKDKYSNLMNTNAEIGSAWNGRILLRIEHCRVDTPCIKTVDIIGKNELDFANKIGRPEMFSAIIKLYSGYYLPEKYDQYSVKIVWQNNYVIFNQKKTDKAQHIDWKTVHNLSCYSISNDINDLPDIFFYLLNPDNIPVCFQRIKGSEFYLNKNIMIIKLFPELSYGKVNSITNAGLLKLKVFLFHAIKDKNKIIEIKEGNSEEEAVEDLEELINGEKKLLERKKYTIICVVYMCRYLISNDKDGNNDPYVRITCDGNKKTTTTKHGTINGIWNEKLIFENVELDLEKKSSWPILLVEIMDYARIGRDDLIGNRYIWLSRSSYSINSPKFIDPKWSQLYLSKSNIPQGEILLSFYLFDSEHKKEIKKIKPKPETTDYTFDINILGLRDMKPLSLLPIRKSFIKFELNSLNVTGDKNSYIKSKSTQPKDKGSNPTINSSIKFNLRLPKNDIFMPQLQCIVYDHILSGLLNPILGVFLINIKKIIKETNKQIGEVQKITKEKIALHLTQGNITHAIGDLGNLDKKIDDKNEQNNIIDTSSKPNIEEKEEIKQDEVIQLDDGSEIKVRFYDSELIEKNKNNSEYFVVLPQEKDYNIPGSKKNSDKIYKIEDESKAPSKEYYLPIGYNEKPDPDNNSKDLSELIQKGPPKIKNITKHYRRYYKQDLESIKELNIKSPFYTEYIRRGKENESNDETAIFTSLTNIKNKIIKKFIPKLKHKDSNSSEESDKFSFDSEDKINLPRNLMDKGFGKFKAVIRICESEKYKSFQKSIEKFQGNEKVLKELKSIEKYENLTKSILVPHEVIIRVYILELRDLPSSCDPYIKIHFGDIKKFDEQKNHKKNEINSKWYKYYDILTVFPGESTLRVEVWNYNAIFKDELIGSTSIDLEDRYFNPDWKKMKLKPIETRALFNPDFSGQQGNLLLWIEIFDKNDLINKQPWNISPEPPSKLEIRLVIWDAETINDEDLTDIRDVYITSYIDQKNRESTDIHFRCTALASFNWRIVFQLDVPRVNNKLTLHCYDKDLFSKDEFICGAEIDLSYLIRIVNNLNVPMSFTKEYVESVSEEEQKNYEIIDFCDHPDDKAFNKFWVQCYKNNQKSGKILCSLEILPMWKASLNKVGKGREEPNTAPTLLPPAGRLKWSMNPLSWFNQFVGPRFRKKFFYTLLIVYLVISLFRYLPSLILELGGKILNPFNYI